MLLGATVCLWFLFLCLPGWCAGAGKSAATFSAAAERIGGLRLGLPAGDVPAIAGCTPDKGKERYEGATGEFVQVWKMPACGLRFKMSGPRQGGGKTVADVTVSAPSGLATSRGIRIGSTEAEVLAAYGRHRDKEGATKPGRTFVAGSIYDGLIFDFKDGRVARIFLGAAAE
jgi:hypothetical protein